MKLDKFKLHSEDEQSFTLSHPSGKMLKIDKQGMSPEAHKMVQSMKPEPVKAADGVDTDDDSDDETPAQPEQDETQREPASQPSMLDQMAKGNVPYTAAPANSPFGVMNQIGSALRTTPDQPKAPGLQVDTNVMPANSGMSGIDMQMKAIKDLATAKGVQAQQEAEAMKANELAMAQQTKDPTQLFKEYQDQDKQLMQAYQSKSIDPDRYWHSLGTGGQILSILGMIVSGAGAGVRGGPNMAYDMLNKSVERDIDAQKSDQSQAMNLWKMNREAYQSEAAANIATRTQMYTGLQYKLQQIAQSNVAPQAQAMAQQAIGQLQMQKDMWNRQMVLHSALQGNVGHGTEQEYVQALNTAAAVNPELYKESRGQYVPGMGIAQGPIEAKDRETFEHLDNLEKIDMRMKNFQATQGWSPNPYGAARQEAETLRGQAVAEYKQLVGLNRLSPEIMGRFETAIKDPGQWNQSQAKQSFLDLQTAIHDARSTTMQKAGIKPFNRVVIQQPGQRKAQ
jgi:hypothetical protein